MRRMGGILFALWICSIVLADVVVVENGEAQATLVCPEYSQKYMKQAIGDFIKYIKASTGAEIPVNDLSKPYRINIKDDPPGLDMTQTLYDGYVIKVVGDTLYIKGARVAGTSCGLYGFLHDFVGVRFYYPDDAFIYVPERKNISLPDGFCKVYRPDFIWRRFGSPPWAQRNRMSVDLSGVPMLGGGHSLAGAIPRDKYGRELPEEMGRRDCQPCFTNPETIEAAVESACRAFEENPMRTTFSLGINDNCNFCECPRCLALDSPLIFFRDRWIHSDSYYYFINEVAKRVGKVYPDRYISLYGYWGVELPPRKIKKLPDNVVVQITQDVPQHHDPRYRRLDRQIVLKWKRKVKHMAMYDYLGFTWILPRYCPHIVASHIKFMAAQDFAGYYSQSSCDYATMGPEMYLVTELLWDSSQDPDRILDKLFADLFEDAADYMKAFYQTLEDMWCNGREGRWFEGLDIVFPELENVASLPHMERALHLLERAYQIAPNEIVRKRIAMIKNNFMSPYYLTKAYSAAVDLREMDVHNLRDLEELVRKACRVLELAEKFREAFGAKNRLASYHYSIEWKRNQAMRYYVESVMYVLARVEDKVYKGAVNITPAQFRKAIEPIGEVCLKECYGPYKVPDIIEYFNRPKLVCQYSKGGIKGEDGYIELGGENFAGREWGGKKDLAVEFKVGWDEKYLYMKFVVHDDKFLQSKSGYDIWWQDSLQIAFDPRRDAFAKPEPVWRDAVYGYDEDDYEYGFTFINGGVYEYCWQSPKGINCEINNIPANIIFEDGKIIYDIRIPWRALRPFVPGLGKMLPFAFVVNDDDGHGRGYMEYPSNHPLTLQKRPADFVPLLFVE